MRDMIRLGQVDPVRKRIVEATQALLGDTITLSDADWQGSTLLPSWSRANVAHHIARSADAMRQLTLAAIDGRQRPLYPSEEWRLAELERGSGRKGLELQIALDTTADGLEEAFGLVTDWLVPVLLPTVGTMPLSALVVARLHEIVLHHLDMGTAYSAAQVDPVTASWLLQWAALRLRAQSGLPALLIQSESGVRQEVGEVGEPHTVSGSDVALWCWLTGRGGDEDLTGADGLRWPLLG